MAEIQKKIRLLCLFDYACTTGFATVSSNIMRELAKSGRFEADIVAINATGDPYDAQRFPYNVFPAETIETISTDGRNPYGFNKFLRRLAEHDYDLVFTIQDSFIISMIMPDILSIIDQKAHRPKTIIYFPIDGRPKAAWMENCIAKFDYPVPYTYYAAEEAINVYPPLKDKLRKPIYHGTNTEEFFPINDPEALAEFKRFWYLNAETNEDVSAGRFLLLNVNRNQPRKDIFRSLQVLQRLRELGDQDSLLYLHMQANDAGGNLLEQARHLNLQLGRDFILPAPHIFNSNRGVGVNTLNKIYNSADCLITTTLGEGWGLSITEAFATKTPVVAPAITSLNEMGADNRMKLVKAGSRRADWVVRVDDNDIPRPTVDVEAFAAAILQIKAGKLPDIDKAYAFAHKYSWQHVCADWLALFEEAYQAAEHDNLVYQSSLKRKQFKKGQSKKDRRRARRK